MADTFSFDLSGRTALVTGASSGLGAHFSRLLAASGARVVLAARRLDRLEALKEEIQSAGGQAVAVALDAASEPSTIAAYDAADAAFGPVDTVIANAGFNVRGPVVDYSADDFDALMSVNLRGVFLTVREGGRRMIAGGSEEHGRGRVVIVSSITSDYVATTLAPYSASKAAVAQFGKVVALEWARLGINVNVIRPGYIRTDLNAAWFDTEAGDRQVGRFPRRRLVQPSDLDALMLFLASDASRAVTGSEFTIDDGQSL